MVVVLIVDDEPVVAESLSAIFKIAGYQAHFAISAEEGFALARQIQPQLLITDVVMPGKTGIQLAIDVRGEFPACKVLLMSGQAETSNLLEEAEQQGHRFEILAKPIWPPDLLYRVERLFAHGDTASEAAAASK